jgi:DNA-binding protein HU-beta
MTPTSINVQHPLRKPPSRFINGGRSVAIPRTLVKMAAIGSEIDRLAREAPIMPNPRTGLLGVGSPVTKEVLTAFLMVVHGPSGLRAHGQTLEIMVISKGAGDTSTSCSNRSGPSMLPPRKIRRELIMPPAKRPAAAAASAKKAPVAAKKAAAPAKKTIAAKAAPQVTITLKQMAAELAEGHNLPKKQAEGVLADLVTVATQHLKKGDKIRLTGLGILQVRPREARMGRNPATGESIKIAASKKIAFRPAKELKESV